MRFRKGTTDHDGDGKMGGSMKENDMAKAPRAKKQVRPDPQSGMDPTADTDEAKRRAAEQFKAADAEGKPRTTKEQAAVEEATLNRQIRGY